MGAGTDGHYARVAGWQANASCRPRSKGKVAKVIGGKLQLPSYAAWMLPGKAIIAGVVDQHVKRPLPRGDKCGVRRGLVNEVELCNVNRLIASRGRDVGGDPRSSRCVANRERDLGA